MVGKSYWIRTFGCQMNEHDSERIAGLLEAQGYRLAPGPEEADVVIFNTCAIRENADNRLYGNLGAIKHLKAERPGMQIVVGGCLAEKDRDLVVRKAPFVDVVLGTRNIDSLPGLLGQAERQGIPVVEFAETLQVFPSALPARRGSRTHAWVAIQFGCNNACTFCIVPTVRGRETSRRIGDILGEVSGLVADGVTEITLLGQNVNSYGRDVYGTPRFADLLLALDGIPGLRRVRFTSPHPKDFREPVARAMAESSVVCEHLHLPVQSGSTRLLKEMKRSYSRERYLEKVEMARRIIPGLALTTDIIVGFPGETDEDFAQTLSLAEEVGYDAAFTFQYSPRPGTEAGVREDQVPKAVVQERFDQLLAVQNRASLACNRAQIGQVVELLIEGPSKKEPGKVSGRTRTNKLVHVPDPAGLLIEGSFVAARIRSAAPHHLEGELLEGELLEGELLGAGRTVPAHLVGAP